MDNGGDTPAPSHEPPSLPASPLPKRTKVIEPSANISVAGTQDTSRTATPTPAAAPLTGLTHPPKPSTNGTTSIMAEPIAVPSLQVKLLSDKGKAPTRGSAFAAGYDLHSAQDTTVPARGKALVDTGISIAVPAGTYGRVAPRSGLAVKHSITTGAGVIDADYRGPVKVVLFNLGDDTFEIKEGDRIAQLVLERIVTPEVTVVAELEESVRGAGGFGSTGGFGEKNITGVV